MRNREGGEGGRVDRETGWECSIRWPWRSRLPSSHLKRLCRRHPARNLSHQLHRDCTSTICSIRMVICTGWLIPPLNPMGREGGREYNIPICGHIVWQFCYFCALVYQQ